MRDTRHCYITSHLAGLITMWVITKAGLKYYHISKRAYKKATKHWSDTIQIHINLGYLLQYKDLAIERTKTGDAIIVAQWYQRDISQHKLGIKTIL